MSNSINKFSLLAGALLGSFAIGYTQSGLAEDRPIGLAASTSVASGEGSKLICQRIEESGSRLKSNRICMTKLQWDEQRRQDRMVVERSQMRNCNGNC